jgi:hypothetical protein
MNSCSDRRTPRLPNRRPTPILFAATRAAALSMLAMLPLAAWSATAPNLGSAGSYGVVSSTYTNSNTSPQTVLGGTAAQPTLCYTTAPVTPPLTIVGTTLVPCPPAVGMDQGLAIADLNGQACTSLGVGAIALDAVIIGANPPGTIPPGCYSSGGAMNITAATTVTLSGAGVYLFRPGGALTTGADSRVVLANGGCAADVYWAPTGAASIGANAALSPSPTFVGTILADAGVAIGHFANLTGRLLAFNGTVSTDAATVNVPGCAAFVGGVAPTLAKSFTPSAIVAGNLATLTLTLGNPNAAVSTLSTDLIDFLPAGVTLAAPPNAGTTCGGSGALLATAGGTSITVPAGRTIPANGSCTVSVIVTSILGGSFVNTLAAGALATTTGSNASLVTATLLVDTATIPTLLGSTVFVLIALLAIAGFIATRWRTP